MKLIFEDASPIRCEVSEKDGTYGIGDESGAFLRVVVLSESI